MPLCIIKNFFITDHIKHFSYYGIGIASVKEILELNKAVTHVAELMGAKDKGYRALTNIGSDGGQEVPHLHFHLLVYFLLHF